MINLKYIFRENKRLIMIALIILICSISIAIGVYTYFTDSNSKGTKNQKENENPDYEDLKSNFEYIFTNSINKETTAKLNINYDEIVYCKYDIKEEKDNYKIEAKIPLFKIENDVTKEINKEIYDKFAITIINIVNNSTEYTTFNLDYVVYVNDNILSLVIRCKYKIGSYPQRNIIQTFNYDIENNKLVDINEMLDYKQLNKEDVQKKVTEKIKEQNAQMKIINDQGYNVYIRNENDSIYKIENTPNFFLGKNNYLYLVYAYGNDKYTSEIDLVIF